MTNRFYGFAAAAALTGAVLTAQPAQAQSTWACEVLLCASNPGGWMQFKDCVPPIRKLITHLGLGGGFPTCTAGGVKKTDYTKPKKGRPGYVDMTMADGTKKRFIVPSNSQVAEAEANPPAGTMEP